MNPADIVERLRGRGRELTQVGDGTLQGLVLQAADEIDRLRELFRKDGEDHAAHVKGLVEQHETRMTRYADEIERLRKVNTKLQRDLSDRISDIFEHDAEIERLRREVKRLQMCWKADQDHAKWLLERRVEDAAEIKRLRVVAQIRYELLRECQSEFRARGATGLVETIEAVLKEKQHEPG